MMEGRPDYGRYRENIQPLLSSERLLGDHVCHFKTRPAIRHPPQKERREMIVGSPSGYGVIFGDVLPPRRLAEIHPSCRQRQPEGQAPSV
ncbi:hypothetical protein HNR46_004216 [Haloferula luteola]|uniref:Uncharacterized protein n=1 Tax=Haloferula luteola TaxID=595692 RepID=A0A840VA39_9BACT|nr:hypothetical protein [Haloferula luteola]